MKNNIRFKNLLKKMEEHNIDYFMIAPSDNLRSLLGFSPGKCERFQALFIKNNGDYFYISPQIYYEEISELISEEKIFVWKDREGHTDLLKKLINKFNISNVKIAVDNSISSVNTIEITNLTEVTWYNGHDLIEELRIIKDSEEQKLLKESALLADKVMDKAINFIKPGIREYDIKSKIKEEAFKLGGDGVAFEPIIASGANSSKPHYNKSDREIKGQDLVLLDLGVIYKGYCSDISRTIFVGEITSRQEEIYNIVKKSTEAAKNILEPGIQAAELDHASRKVISKAGYGDCFLNRLGHGIGMSVHEAPYINGNNDRVLQPGMAFSIEPGIYLPDEFGIRIEDIVLVTKDGFEVLNEYNRDIIII